MPKLQLELSNPQNWTPLWACRLDAGQVWGLQVAIPEQTVPILIDSPIIVAKASCLAGSPTWKFGGTLTPRLQTGNSQIPEVLIKTHRLSLRGPNLIFLEELGQYRIQVCPPKWFPSFELDLWAYSGPYKESVSCDLDQSIQLLQGEKTNLGWFVW